MRIAFWTRSAATLPRRGYNSPKAVMINSRLRHQLMKGFQMEALFYFSGGTASRVDSQLCCSALRAALAMLGRSNGFAVCRHHDSLSSLRRRGPLKYMLSTNHSHHLEIKCFFPPLRLTATVALPIMRALDLRNSGQGMYLKGYNWIHLPSVFQFLMRGGAVW